MQDFELSFSNFLDDTEYDKAESAVFSLVRMAFKAGWLAAGGETPSPTRVTQLLGAKYVSSPEADCQKG